MKVANASFSQMPVPPAHRHEVAEPHVGDLVGHHVGHALELGVRGALAARSTSSAVSRKVIAPRFSIAPPRSRGSAIRSSLSPGYGDAVVAAEEVERECADL